MVLKVGYSIEVDMFDSEARVVIFSGNTLCSYVDFLRLSYDSTPVPVVPNQARIEQVPFQLITQSITTSLSQFYKRFEFWFNSSSGVHAEQKV